MEGRVPSEMVFNGNVAASWSLWKQKFSNFMLATGDEGLEIFNTLNLPPDSKLVDVIKRFDEYCNPLKNLVYEHFKFFNRNQQEGETIDQFYTELKKLASTCEFMEGDVLILDRIVIGTCNLKIQERLLSTTPLTLQDALSIARSIESGENKVREIASSSTQVCALRKSRPPIPRNPHVKCNRCGTEHSFRKCPAFSRNCNGCGRRGHYQEFCRLQNVSEVLIGDPDTTSKQSESPNTVWSVTQSKSVNSVGWYQKLRLNGTAITLKVDTGSDVNILSESDFRTTNITLDHLQKTDIILNSYTGHALDIIGSINLETTHGNLTIELKFYVIKGKSSSILGLQGSISLGIIPSRTSSINELLTDHYSTSQVISKFSKIFEGIGKIDKPYKIELTDDAVPVICGARKIPQALHDKVKKKLDEMVNDGVLTAVHESSDWAHPIVCVPKASGDVRICIDPRNLNKYLKRPRFHIPTQDELFSDLSNAKYFSKLDASQAFLQIPLDEESSHLCTISTVFGRYRFTRLPYGLSSAPEYFQKINAEILAGTKAKVYFDDILIHAPTIEEHNATLELVLQKLWAAGVKLNRDKSCFCVQKVSFLGHMISPNGIEPDDTKIKAIVEMGPPTDVKSLQRFLGMITYLAKFVPNLSQETATLRNLLKAGNTWVWTENENECFRKLKKIITKAPTLGHFNPNVATILSVDASQAGLGALMLQSGRPIGYASVSLNSSQQRYNQIEKELLAIVFGFERFHYYVYGQNNVIVETDHRPLLGLLKKPLDEVSPRLQRLAIRLLRYRFELRYVPGKNLTAADALSRAPTTEKIDTTYLSEDILHVCALVISSKNKEMRLKKALEADCILFKIKNYALNGWPNQKSDCDAGIKPFWQIRDSIFFHDDLLFFNNRVIIPECLQREFLQVIHKTHLGVVACKNLAREAIYWPGLMTDIENLILACETCQKYAKSNTREPLNSHEIPEFPWQKIGVDFKAFGNVDFLVVCDYFSKFIAVQKLSSKTSSAVCTALRNVFSCHGFPQTIMSDCGPPFQSREFQEFAKLYDIELISSSPTHSQSNGLVERAIQSVKAMLHKSGSDLCLAVVNHNNAPRDNGYAPSQLLMGRRLRSLMPVPKQLLAPQFTFTGVVDAQRNNKIKQKSYYDRVSKRLPPLQVGQPVYVQSSNRLWKPATVVELGDNNDYVVSCDENSRLRRNRVYLRPRRTNPPRLTKAKADKAMLMKTKHSPKPALTYAYNESAPETDCDEESKCETSLSVKVDSDGDDIDVFKSPMRSKSSPELTPIKLRSGRLVSSKK